MFHLAPSSFTLCDHVNDTWPGKAVGCTSITQCKSDLTLEFKPVKISRDHVTTIFTSASSPLSPYVIMGKVECGGRGSAWAICFPPGALPDSSLHCWIWVSWLPPSASLFKIPHPGTCVCQGPYKVAPFQAWEDTSSLLILKWIKVFFLWNSTHRGLLSSATSC